MKPGVLYLFRSSALLAALAVGVLFGAAVTGIILLILGLVRRRRGMWIGGLVTLIVSLVLLVLAGMGLLKILA
ncbi:MAG: hypothetical protein AMJ81_07640 [Phycisphaerae bacterium SM23_33]|nr:MAG: hypothetical protein AMJ81_07640 [Phycisphaerae bacterium SM23_33]